jgi:tripartite-type tricarboxylate transporter receptor subunit TctC
MFAKILKQASQVIVMSMLATSALAAEWPTRTVKIISNLPIGTLPDVVYRKTAELLSEKWQQPVIVENRPGGGGLVALGEFEREGAKDDHVIFAPDTGVVAILPIITPRKDMLKNIQPIGLSFVAEMWMITSSKYTNEQAFEEFRKRPIFGSWAVGSIAHICGLELTTALSSNPAEHVAYKEYGVWYTDLHNQAFPLSCSSYGSARAMIESGKVRVIAVAADKRDPKMPQVPTVREITGQDVKFTASILGYFVHNNLDKKIANKIERDLMEVSQSAEVKALVERGHGTSLVLNSKDFARYLTVARTNLARTTQKHQLKLDQ